MADFESRKTNSATPAEQTSIPKSVEAVAQTSIRTLHRLDLEQVADTPIRNAIIERLTRTDAMWLAPYRNVFYSSYEKFDKYPHGRPLLISAPFETASGEFEVKKPDARPAKELLYNYLFTQYVFDYVDDVLDSFLEGFENVHPGHDAVKLMRVALEEHEKIDTEHLSSKGVEVVKRAEQFVALSKEALDRLEEYAKVNMEKDPGLLDEDPFGVVLGANSLLKVRATPPILLPSSLQTN